MELAQPPHGALSEPASGPLRALEMPSGGNDAKIIRPHANNVTWMELLASPQLGLTLDGYLTASDHGLGVGSA